MAQTLSHPFTPLTHSDRVHPPRAPGLRFDSVEKPMKPDRKKNRKKDEKKKRKVKTSQTSKELTEGELDKVQGGIARNAKPL
jgi:hypothetical protein